MRKFIMLGSGTSSGVPRIGNDWGSCDPQQPYNRRSRASGMIIIDGFSVLIDTGPDLRQQMLSNNLSDVNAVIWTHDHADHCHGIDDLRPIRQNHDAPLWVMPQRQRQKD